MYLEYRQSFSKKAGCVGTKLKRLTRQTKRRQTLTNAEYYKDSVRATSLLRIMAWEDIETLITKDLSRI